MPNRNYNWRDIKGTSVRPLHLVVIDFLASLGGRSLQLVARGLGQRRVDPLAPPTGRPCGGRRRGPSASAQPGRWARVDGDRSDRLPSGCDSRFAGAASHGHALAVRVALETRHGRSAGQPALPVVQGLDLETVGAQQFLQGGHRGPQHQDLTHRIGILGGTADVLGVFFAESI